MTEENCVQEITNLPVNIVIGTVSGNSGIYLGKELTVSGLSSHSKVNNGFGSVGDSNALYRNLSYVYDPDVIDTPIDDRDLHILYRPPVGKPSPSVTNIGLGSFFVNTMQQNSGTFLGNTTITGMDSHEKQNMGHGHIHGNWNLNYGSLNWANDQDFLDTIINDQDNKAGIFFNT